MLKSKRKLSKDSKGASSSGKKKKPGREVEDGFMHEMENNVFCKMVISSGLVVTSGEQQNKIKIDQTFFQKNLSNTLKRHHNYPQIVDEFIEGLLTYTEDLKRFCHSLLPTLTCEDCEESFRGPTQDSLTRILLGIDILQPVVANLLLEKIPEFSEDDQRVPDHDMPRLIMSQFKWLDTIIKPKDLSEKLLEIISVSSVECQREIITCIPEIFDDDEHNDIGTALVDIMMQNSQLTVAILDTLTNLNLKTELLAEVRTSVINMLASTEMDDLPVAVKFILQSVSDQEALAAITELRSNLEFSCPLIPAATSTPSKARRSAVVDKSKDGILLTLEAVKSSIRFQKSIADGWLKTLENINDSVEHLVIDVFVILILHSVTNKRKTMEGLFRNKIRSGYFGEDVLKTAFTSYTQVLREYFDTLLLLAEVLLRSPDQVVSAYAQKIYVEAFLSFDLYCKQEVVGALVTHIGSGLPSETDSSLDVLKDLVENHPLEMAPFAIFLKGILDYLDNLTISQIRKLFSLLSMLAFYNNDGSMIQDDMHMVIRKQLSSNSVKYKRIGIIGAIMIVRGMACSSSNKTKKAQNENKSNDEDRQKQVVGLLEMVRSSINNVPEAASLFYDELANVIEKKELDSKTEGWISDTVVGDFQEDFLVDLDSPLPSSGIPIDNMWGLDDTEEGCISFNLVTMMFNQSQNTSSNINNNTPSDSIVTAICSAPHFRLLRVCEQSQHEGTLEGIDALLGCPVVMFKMEEVLETFEKLNVEDRELVCGALFHCLNWFRELINAFSTERDPEMKGKTLSRLQSITMLQKWLESCLRETPSFVPPLVHFDAEESFKKALAPKLSNGVKRTRKGNTKNRSKDGDKTVDEDIDKESEGKDETVVEEKRKDKNSSQSLLSSSKYRPCFRELDLNVFEMLKCGLVSKAVLDSNMQTEMKVILHLQAPELYFLVDDLHKKLEYSLASSGKSTLAKFHQGKQVGYSHLSQKPALDVVIYLLGLLPNICEHLETASAFFQELIESNDGLLDGPGRNTEEARLMDACFERLLSCLVHFLSWSGFTVNRNRCHLKAAFAVLTSRIKVSKKTQPGFQELVSQGFHYFEQFSPTIPSLGTAVALVKLLAVLKTKSENENTARSLSNICGDFLKREWIQADGQREQGAKFNEHLQYLLKCHIQCAEDPLVVMEMIATGAFAELLEHNEQPAATLPTLTKSSFPACYKSLLNCLVTYFKNSQSTPIKQVDCIEVKKERLTQINIAVRIFHILVNLVKAFELRSVLGAALKYGRMFVESFVNSGMPVLDDMLRTNKDDIHALLKSFQQSTRSLQHFCGHSKVVKDIALTNHVPAMKKSLEMFVFRVKAMLAVNKCTEAFWVGNLKNRDIRGQEISSQLSTKDKEEDDDEQDDEDEDEEEGGKEEQKSNDDQESVMSGETGDADDDEGSYSESF